jgi:hypothetical protein
MNLRQSGERGHPVFFVATIARDIKVKPPEVRRPKYDTPIASWKPAAPIFYGVQVASRRVRCALKHPGAGSTAGGIKMPSKEGNGFDLLRDRHGCTSDGRVE